MRSVVKCAFRKVSMDRITFLDSLVPKMMLVVNFFILRNWGRVGRLASSARSRVHLWSSRSLHDC